MEKLRRMFEKPGRVERQPLRDFLLSDPPDFRTWPCRCRHDPEHLKGGMEKEGKWKPWQYIKSLVFVLVRGLKLDPGRSRKSIHFVVGFEILAQASRCTLKSFSLRTLSFFSLLSLLLACGGLSREIATHCDDIDKRPYPFKYMNKYICFTIRSSEIRGSGPCPGPHPQGKHHPNRKLSMHSNRDAKTQIRDQGARHALWSRILRLMGAPPLLSQGSGTTAALA